MEQMVPKIQYAWEGVSKDVHDVLISTMPHRMKAVINAKGGSTKWKKLGLK